MDRVNDPELRETTENIITVISQQQHEKTNNIKLLLIALY